MVSFSRKGAGKIELTEEQRQSIRQGNAVRVRDNGHEYVVLHPDEYNRLSEEEHDDSSWTAEELDRLREESTALLDEYGKNA